MHPFISHKIVNFQRLKQGLSKYVWTGTAFKTFIDKLVNDKILLSHQQMHFKKHVQHNSVAKQGAFKQLLHVWCKHGCNSSLH